jgi:hypothetical protein
MNIIRVIERKFARLLGRDVAGRTKADPPATAPRLCQYGHTVFEGNNRCNYGHRPA